MNKIMKTVDKITSIGEVVLGIAFCIGYYGFIIEAVIQGILVAGAAAIVKDLFHKSNYLTKRDQNGKE